MVNRLSNLLPSNEARICKRCRKAHVEEERVRLLNSHMCAACAYDLEATLGKVNGRPLKTCSPAPNIRCLPRYSESTRSQMDFSFGNGTFSESDPNWSGTDVKVTHYRRKKKTPQEEARDRERREPAVARIYDDDESPKIS